MRTDRNLPLYFLSFHLFVLVYSLETDLSADSYQCDRKILGWKNILSLCIKAIILTCSRLNFFRLTVLKNIRHSAEQRLHHAHTRHTCAGCCLYLFEELQIDCHGQEVLHGAGTMIHKALLAERYWLPLRSPQRHETRQKWNSIMNTISFWLLSLFFHYVYSVQRRATGTKADMFGALEGRGSKLNNVVLILFTAMRCSHHVSYHYAV